MDKNSNTWVIGVSFTSTWHFSFPKTQHTEKSDRYKVEFEETRDESGVYAFHRHFAGTSYNQNENFLVTEP
jgi:hypothetical protein